MRSFHLELCLSVLGHFLEFYHGFCSLVFSNLPELSFIWILVLLNESSNFLIVSCFPSLLLFALLSVRLYQFNAPHFIIYHIFNLLEFFLILKRSSVPSLFH